MFKEKGYEVHVATNGTEEIPYCDVKHVISFERSPIKINNLKAIKDLKKIIDKEKFDIIHCHTPMGSVVTRIAAKKARKRGTRVIYTAHGFHFFKGAPLLNWIIFYPIEKHLSKYTDCLITINQEDYELAKRKFKAKQIELVHGVGVDESKFNFEMTKEEKHELRESLGLKDDDFVLIQVGELNKNKNQIMAIKAMKELVKENSKIHLLIVGKGELENYYKGKIQEYNLEQNIHMLGYRNDIPKLMKISDVLLSLSYREGLPVNVIEGMISGLEIIATDCRGNRDLIENTIQINNIRELHKQILKRYEQEKKSNYIFSSYLENYVVDKMKKIYDVLAKKKIMHLLASNSYSGAENVACMIINEFNTEYDMAYCSTIGRIEETLKEKKIDYYPIRKITRRELKKVIKEYKPDIIHAHDVRASYIASAFHRKINIISHIHGNHLFMRKTTIKSLLYRNAIKKFKHIFWVSESCLENFKFKKKAYSKSSILFNVINTNDIKNKIEQDDNIYNYDVVFLGRLNEAKNPMRMINIFNRVYQKNNTIKFAIIGDGEYYEKLSMYIKDNSLEKAITLFGFKENPYKILKCSKLLLMTSVHEGVPMVALETMSLGIPIVSTPTDGMINLIDDSIGLLSDDDDDIIKKIIEIIDIKDDSRKEMTDRVISKFKNINNLKQYKDKIKKYY